MWMATKAETEQIDTAVAVSVAASSISVKIRVVCFFHDTMNTFVHLCSSVLRQLSEFHVANFIADPFLKHV